MAKRLFLLDGMALVYRAHFALISRPIFTSKGVNTSALYGFTQTLLDILSKQQPTHIAVAFDTQAPTQRHVEYADYKATRQAMPEDLVVALPHVRRLLEAFHIPVLTCDGYEADDIIGTLVCRARTEGYTCYMVTPDKDFGQLVGEGVFIYKPGRMGDSAEIMGVAEVCRRWGIARPEQVIEILALMGDSSDNIPGVPGIGEKTAAKLVTQYGGVENLLTHAGELTGRLKDTLEKNRETALLSKRLATLICDVPCPVDLESLKLQPRDDDQLKSLLIEFEFNSIGKRLYGDDFKAGRGFQQPDVGTTRGGDSQEADLAGMPPASGAPTAEPISPGSAPLKTLSVTPHEYQVAASPADRARLIDALRRTGEFSFAVIGTATDPKQAEFVGLAVAVSAHRGWFVPFPADRGQAARQLEEFRPLLESEAIEKIGHNLKFSLGMLEWRGLSVRGKLFDTMVAHSLSEPEMRHSLEYLSEAYLGYTPAAPPTAGDSAELLPGQANSEALVERADLALQLREILIPQLKQKDQERVFYQIESPLIAVLAAMETEGIKIDADALSDFGAQLSREIAELEGTILRLAGTPFNLNSPRQLGQVLFEVLKIGPLPKKTKTGQYSTDEQTLAGLAPDHEIVRKLLEYRVASKLKSTYADALPAAIWPATGRVHTTFNQVMTSTGRLNSQDPNLQNIPIRTERGQEIRKAFVPRGPDYLLLSADYSQIELRIIAALSREPGLLEAFRTRADVHTATAARVFGVFPEMVTPEMRRKAKMVNYGIAYGISAFGLAQRLGIPRKEAAEIIDQYFTQFSGIRQYMDDTVAFARQHGYVETVTGRRRYLRDINSSNNSIKAAAERNAINAPIQGTAADMIKLAMVQIDGEIRGRQLRTRMLLQVHDELVFDVYRPEESVVRTLVEARMKTALRLEVPIEVEIGVGRTWLEAH